MAMLWEIIDIQQNPMSLVSIRATPDEETIEKRVLSPTEFQGMMELIPEPYCTMCIVACCMGLRVSEILGLQWGDFDWKKLEVRIQRAVVLGIPGQVKTIKSKAPMPLDRNLATVLVQHARNGNAIAAPDQWVFVNPSTDKPWRPSHIQSKYIRPAGLTATGVDGFSWHNFRHTFSTMLRELGTDIKVQQELLRHADISTTLNVYTQGSAAQKREAVGKVVGMVLPPINTEGQPALPFYCPVKSATFPLWLNEMLGWEMGIEPTTSGATVRCSAS